MPPIRGVAQRALAGALTLLLMAPAVAHAASQRDQRLRSMIVDRVHAVDPSAQVEIGSLRGLQSVSPCRSSPRLRFYGSGTDRDMRISCPALGWQIYVSVRLLQREKILVAAHDIPAGTRLHRDDLKSEFVGSSATPFGIAHDFNVLIGHRLLTPVGSGQPIYLAEVRHRVLVHAGQEVLVRVDTGSVKIRTSAIAMQDGVAGQSILVKNPSTGTPFRVEVTRHGVIDNFSG